MSAKAWKARRAKREWRFVLFLRVPPDGDSATFAYYKRHEWNRMKRLHHPPAYKTVGGQQ